MEKISTAETNKKIVRHLYEEILNSGHLNRLQEVIDSSYIGPQNILGPDGFARSIAPVLKAFPKIHWTIEEMIADDDRVMVKWHWNGKNTSSFDGFPVSNADVTHRAINIFTFQKNKIIGASMLADRLGFYQQIGVISEDAIKPR